MEEVIMNRREMLGAVSLLAIAPKIAFVQWVGDDTFGVSFQSIRPAELDELEQLIDEYDEAEGSGHA